MIRSIRIATFFVLLAAVGVVVVMTFWPFWQMIALASILAWAFLPIHHWFLKKIKSETFSAIATMAVIFIILMIPGYFLVRSAIREILLFIQHYEDGSLVAAIMNIIQAVPPEWRATAGDVVQRFFGSMVNVGSLLIRTTSFILSSAAMVVLNLFVLLMATFFFLKDRRTIASALHKFLPLSDGQENMLTRRIGDAVTGVTRGTFLTALAQGLTALAGFAFAGLSEAIVLGIATFFAAFIPIFGVGIVFTPVMLYLLATRSFAGAIILAIWWIIAANIDNVLRPYLVGTRASIHPLAVLLGAFGGIEVFGPLGVVFGPILIAIFMALVESYNVMRRG